jgi:hypothetical protein
MLFYISWYDAFLKMSSNGGNMQSWRLRDYIFSNRYQFEADCNLLNYQNHAYFFLYIVELNPFGIA